MKFAQLVAGYKNLKEDKYYMKSFPKEFWKELEKFIIIGSGQENEYYLDFLPLCNTIIKTEIKPDSGWHTNLIEELQKNYDNGRFDRVMDCIGILIKFGSLETNQVNNTFKKLNIGYECYKVQGEVKWSIVKDFYAKDLIYPCNEKVECQRVLDQITKFKEMLENFNNKRETINTSIEVLSDIIKENWKYERKERIKEKEALTKRE